MALYHKVFSASLLAVTPRAQFLVCKFFYSCNLFFFKHEGIGTTATFTELSQMDQAVGSLISYDLTILVAVADKKYWEILHWIVQNY